MGCVGGQLTPRTLGRLQRAVYRIGPNAPRAYARGSVWPCTVHARPASTSPPAHRIAVVPRRCYTRAGSVLPLRPLPETLPIGHPSLVRGEGWVAAGRERHGHVPGRARGHGRTGHRRQAHRGGDAGHFGGFEPLNSSRVDEQGQGVRQREKVRQRDRPARGCTGSSLNALTTPMYFTRRREQRAGSAQQRALGAFVPPPPTRRGFALTVRGWEPRGAQLPRAAPLLLSDRGGETVTEPMSWDGAKGV